MLEQDLTELFELQAGEEPPPAHASMTAAARHGRTRLRRRRTLSIAAPVLAAMAVLAVALSGTIAAPVPAPPRPASGQSPSAGLHEVPPLFFWPGWLPPGMKVLSGELLAPRLESLTVGISQEAGANQQYGVTAFSKSGCTMRPAKLYCSFDFQYALGASAGTVDGFPAYWSDGSRLVFERASGLWATVNSPTHADDLRIERNLTAHVPAIRYPVQLTGNWPGVGIADVGFTYRHGRAIVDGLAFGRGTALTPRGSDALTNTADVGVGKAGSNVRVCGTGGRDEVLDGYPVVDTLIPGESERVCGYDVRGQALVVMTNGKQPYPTAPVVFTHLRLFGLNPANWPSTPVR
jgi:hypothetical protein